MRLEIRGFFGRAAALFCLLCLACCIGIPVRAQQYKVLHNFVYGYGDGFGPEATLIFDSNGNLYGTTYAGGNPCEPPGCGVVFELSPGFNGNWTETLLQSFNGSNGSFSLAPVVFDNHGNLLGSTRSGGSAGQGTVFELTHGSGEGWTEIVRYSFTGGAGGGQPGSDIALDASGNLYGTTSAGGADTGGVAFRLGSVNLPGENVLHSFGSGTDCSQPSGSLSSDAAGNLYGTAWAGGTNQLGCVFQLVRNPLNGNWTETVLYSFHGSDGANPNGGVILDAAGNVYGTTCTGGAGGAGTVFKLSPNGGSWDETVLHSFGTANDGGSPFSGVTFDAYGNLYGTTHSGGSSGRGTVFRLAPLPTGRWVETILHDFDVLEEGWWPIGGVVLDSAGNIYGTTVTGGTGGLEYGGVIFEITP